MKKIFVIFLLFPIILSAQDKKFKIGFSLNSYGLILSDGNNKNETVASTLQFPLIYNLNFKYTIDKNFSLQSKLGYVLPIIYFNGFEYGITGEYNFSNNNYYATIGLMKHNNSEGEEAALEADITFINTGLGYKVSKYFSIEAIYFYPLNREIIYNGSLGAPYIKNPKYIKRIESMIYLSFVFGWDL